MCNKSVLRWYEITSETVNKEGFQINPYDRCGANKIINKKQHTIEWYVNGNKISHEDHAAVTQVIKLLKKFLVS